MPLLRSLRLSHFRSHKSITLDFPPGPVGFFGPNGSGKTNVLEAISLLSPGRGLRRASGEELARVPESLGWKVSAELHNSGQDHEIETWAEPGASRQVRIDGKAATQTALGRLCPMLWLVPAMDRIWLEGAGGRRRFLDRMVLSFAPSHADHALMYEKAMRERNRLLKDQVRDPHWYRALETRMATSAAEILLARKQCLHALERAQDEGTSAFPTAALTLTQPEGGELPETADGLAEMFEATRRRDIAAGRTTLGPHRTELHALFQSKDMPAKNCSTGEQKALLISLVLANGRALARMTGAPPILLLDEIAAHLDTERRATLYGEIQALGAQAFMTGTGAELFEELPRDSTKFEVAETHGESRVKSA